MDTAYSIVAVKYVGSTPAQTALDALRSLHADGSVSLGKAMAVTRSTGGEMHYIPVVPVTLQQNALRTGVAGFVLGLALSRRLRWTLLGAAMGATVAWLVALLRKQELAAIAPYVEKNESILYMQIKNADWPEFQTRMRPYLAQGLPVIRDIAPMHRALAELFEAPTELRMPPREQFPEPPSTGTPVPEASPEPMENSGESVSAEDDLSALRGIGPVISGRLYASGIRTFAQLAAMNAEEVAQITGVSPSRVTNNDWIGQARELASTT